jgi:hypothetical protein
MKKRTKFQPGMSGCPEKQFKSGNPYRWQAGQSGNPAGTSRRRCQFDEEFIDALITEGSPEEAAKLLWQAARAGEAWAIQHLCQRFAPQTQSLRMVHEIEQGEFDATKLTQEQLDQLAQLMEAGTTKLPASEGGTGPAKSA